MVLIIIGHVRHSCFLLLLIRKSPGRSLTRTLQLKDQWRWDQDIFGSVPLHHMALTIGNHPFVVLHPLSLMWRMQGYQFCVNSGLVYTVVVNASNTTRLRAMKPLSLWWRLSGDQCIVKYVFIQGNIYSKNPELINRNSIEFCQSSLVCLGAEKKLFLIFGHPEACKPLSPPWEQ